MSETAAAPEAMSTRRLVLEPVAARHAPVLHALIADWEIVRMLAGVPWPVTLADVEAHVAGQAAPDAESRDWAVFAGADLVGAVALKCPGRGNPPRVMPRLGYWIGRACWGRGYAREAVAALVARAFAAFPHDVVGAGIFADNPASRRVLEALGFREIGRYETPCLSRGVDVPVMNMNVTRGEFESRVR